MSPAGRPATFPIKKLVAIDQELQDAIDRAQIDQPDSANQTETIRRILRHWLIGHGYLKADK
jgi:hypothetical protein